MKFYVFKNIRFGRVSKNLIIFGRKTERPGKMNVISHAVETECLGTRKDENTKHWRVFVLGILLANVTCVLCIKGHFTENAISRTSAESDSDIEYVSPLVRSDTDV